MLIVGSEQLKHMVMILYCGFKVCLQLDNPRLILNMKRVITSFFFKQDLMQEALTAFRISFLVCIILSSWLYSHIQMSENLSVSSANNEVIISLLC